MIRFDRLMLVPLLALAGCGDKHGSPTDGVPKEPPSPAAAALLLKADPGEAISVLDAKIDGAADGVVVTGRIRQIVNGLVAFTLMDLDKAYCGEQCEESCPTPWDYCCDSPKTILANSLNVEARGADGKPIATPALPNLRLLDTVKVTGRMTVDDHGNSTLLATGFWRVERPQLPAGLRWPQ